MKVSELIKSLQEDMFIYGDIDVVVASDEEGNEFHFVSEADSYFHDGEGLTEKVICLWPEGRSIDMFLFDITDS